MTVGLTEIAKLTEKAVLNNCMHVFCVECISRWASKKRVCPLCKVRDTSDWHNKQQKPVHPPAHTYLSWQGLVPGSRHKLFLIGSWSTAWCLIGVESCGPPILMDAACRAAYKAICTIFRASRTISSASSPPLQSALAAPLCALPFCPDGAQAL